MLRFYRSLTRTLLAVLLPFAAAAAQRPESGPPRVVEPADYGRFETLEETVISPDGRWLAVPVARVDGSRSLSLHRLQETSEPVVIEQADEPVFSEDSGWLAYLVVPTEKEVEALEKDDEPVRHRAELRKLEDGETIDLGAVSSVSFSEDGRYLASRGYPDSSSDEEDETDARPSAELGVRSLARGQSAAFGNVVEAVWQDDDTGSLLAFVVETASGAHAVQLYRPDSGGLEVLDSGSERYSGLSWREDAADLAVLRASPDDDYESADHNVVAFRGLDADAVASVFVASAADGFPEGVRVVEHRELSWSDDGARVFFGTATWRRKPEDASSTDDATREEEEPADVEVWHSRDERIVAMQRVRKDEDREANLIAAWNVDSGSFHAVGTDILESVDLLEGGDHAVETHRIPYRFDNMFDRPRHDLVLVDTATGRRESIAEGVQYGVSGSATGRYVLYFKGGHHHVYDTTTAQTTNLTKDLDTSFVNDEYDTPVREENPPWGNAGFTSNDEVVLLYDRYDVWAVAPGGVARRLTNGASDSVRHRVVTLDDEAKGLDGSQPIYVSLYGEWTKQSGFGRVRVDATGVERLVFRDKGLRRLAKAKKADVYTFVEESASDSPDVFTAGAALADATRVTDTNPFQGDFLWTRSELIDYESGWGKKLQGALYYPADYDPAKSYPMIVYVYERLSQNLHRYTVPDEKRYYNPAVWTQQGYFVLNPDIAYRDRDPGPSAVDCVVPAVEAALDSRPIDRAKVGLVGHSWGGYEASFIPTQTDMFATSIAGAPLTNFFSMFGTIHWSGGYPETSHFETGQARMEVPYWEDREAYFRNSPVTFLPALTTPMLVFFGDEDGTVDFHQGVELYNYARRAGKHLVMLVYRGEDHGARKKKNQVDYHRRILRWFGHFLKGEPAEDWITKGQTLLEREREIESSSQESK